MPKEMAEAKGEKRKNTRRGKDVELRLGSRWDYIQKVKYLGVYKTKQRRLTTVQNLIHDGINFYVSRSTIWPVAQSDSICKGLDIL